MLNRLLRGALYLVTRRKRALSSLTPARFGLTFEEVAFRSAHPDSVELSGWLIPCSNARGLILLCPGIDSNRQWMLRKAVMLHRHGFASLLFDFRARGGSGGAMCTLGVREPDDVLGAVDYVASRPDLAALPLGAIGESLGASSLVLAMTREPRIRCAVLEACFLSFERAVYHRVKWLGSWAPALVERFRSLCQQQFQLDIGVVSPLERIAELCPRPLLLIHDILDWSCPAADTARLLARAGQPKELWSAFCPHVCAAHAAPGEYERRVAAFFSSQMP